MAVDALAPYVARPSAAMIFSVQDERVFAFHAKGLYCISPCEFSVLRNDLECQYINLRPKNKSAQKGWYAVQAISHRLNPSQ